VHTWQESSAGPETVTTEVDEHGNVITRTVRTQQVKHTIQKQSYQTYELTGGEDGRDHENNPAASSKLPSDRADPPNFRPQWSTASKR
jgi:hypothetical protein